MKLTFALPLPERPSENLSAAPALDTVLRYARRTSDKGFDIRMLWRGSLRRLLAALFAHYPIEAVTGHEHIAPGRKTDPGHFFDWGRVARWGFQTACYDRLL